MRPWAALGLLVVFLCPTALAAQQAARADGVVSLAGTPPTPVEGVRVVLHRVGRATQGPIDTVHTGRGGRFAFVYALDTTANYLVSAQYAGIEYFSQPLAARAGLPDSGISLVVFDTSSTVPVATRSRTLVIGAPDPLGARTVIDWFVLDNREQRTRVNPDSLDPTWSAPLPPSARNVSLGDARVSVISPDAVLFRNDSVVLVAPVSPGSKELLLQYELPPDLSRLELDVAAIDSVELFLEERAASVPTAGWNVRDSQMFEGRAFRRFHREVAGPAVAVRFPRRVGEEVLPLLVAATAVLLVGFAWYRLRRPAGGAAPPV